MKLAFENNVTILWTASLTAVCLIGVTVAHHRLDLSIPWLVSLFLLYLARYRLYLRFLAAKDRSATLPAWRRKFHAGALAAGIFWGAGVCIVFPEDSIAMQGAVMITVFGILGVTTIAYAADLRAAVLFNTPLTALLVARLWYMQASYSLTLILGTVIVYSIMHLLSRNLEKYAMDSLWVKFQNIGLAESLDFAHARSQAMAGAAFEGLLVCDDNMVMDANEPFLRTFGYPSLDSLKGKPVLDLVAEESVPTVIRKMESNAGEAYEITARGAGGRLFHVEIQSKDLPYLDRHVRVSAIREITKRKLAEDEARRRHKLQEGLAAAANALIGAEDPEPAFLSVVTSLGFTAEVDRSHIFQIVRQADASVAVRRAAWAAAAEQDYAGPSAPERIVMDEAPGIFALLAGHRSFGGRASALEGAEREFLRGRGALSALMVPVFSSGALWGFIGFESSGRERVWTEEEQSVMWAIAYNIGMFLDRRKSEEEFRKLGAAIGQLDEMVVITGLDGRIEYANAAVAAVTGYSPQELIGANPRVFKSGMHDESYYASIWQAVARGERWNGRIINKRKNGELYDEEMTISPMRSPSGAITHFAAIKRDVTGKVKAERELRAAKEKAEEATALKDKFVSLVAHDLRSPLASALGFINLARGKKAGEGEFLERSSTVLSGMLGMIDELLDLTMLQAGKIQPKWEKLDIMALAAGLLAENGAAAAQKGISVASHIPAGFAAMGDRRLVYEAMRNIFTNAIKFTPAGGTVSFHAGETEEASLISIRDTGVGIKQEMAADLFRHDVKTTSRGTGGEKGSGLGLPLSYEIIKAHGGDITVITTPGKGSQFTISLPKVQASAKLDG